MIEDKFILGLNLEDSNAVFKNISLKKRSATTLPSGKQHGAIQRCPSCKHLRVTSCCACGCGICYTCDYRFTCMPVVPSKPIYLNLE